MVHGKSHSKSMDVTRFYDLDHDLIGHTISLGDTLYRCLALLESHWLNREQKVRRNLSLGVSGSAISETLGFHII